MGDLQPEPVVTTVGLQRGLAGRVGGGVELHTQQAVVLGYNTGVEASGHRALALPGHRVPADLMVPQAQTHPGMIMASQAQALAGGDR
jgi:hypothetical protein